MIWYFSLAALLVLALLPRFMEARRRPVDASLRDQAPGRFVALSQGHTHYQWSGPDRTHVIVLIHGLSSPSWVFAGIERGLVISGYRVLSYDLYGRGYSDSVAGAQTLGFHTRQLGELLDALGVDEPVSLLGYSMGGAIATRFAAEQPGRVDRLILLAPAGIAYTPGPLLRLAGKSGMFGSWLWGLFGGLSLRRAATRDAAAPTVIPNLADRIKAETRRKGYLPAILSSERHALQENLEAEHRKIAGLNIPTKAIWGEKDPVIPISAMGELARWNRQAHQDIISGAGHGLAHANPKEVLATFREFLHDIPE